LKHFQILFLINKLNRFLIMLRLKLSVRFLFLLLISFAITTSPAKAYSVLTHEALIDASWDKFIKPLLKAKYPSSTDDQLREAHAYAYGGSLLADMGYYPFGSEYFTNLAHYARSGDFVQNLLGEAQNVDEYAFAVGSLCHYYADEYGHSLATNLTVPEVYPKMEKRFGSVVTYDDDHISHSRIELSFDVLEIARGNYASTTYHDFIGFQVSKPLLERAFLKTYGEDINDVFNNLDLSISTFRWAVKSLFPVVTHSAWELKKNDIRKLNPSANEHKFHYRMKRKAYYKEFGSSREKPTFKEELVAFIIQIIPKIGPFKALKFKDVGPDGEKKFIASFDSSLTHYETAIGILQGGKLTLTDLDYDTGKPTMPGEYGLTDKTYVDLLDNLSKNKFMQLTAPLQQNILNFYNKADTAQFAAKYPGDWKKTSLALQQLKAATPVKMDSLKNDKGIYYKLIEAPPAPAGGTSQSEKKHPDAAP
jgi:hypothetical protein